jgi:Fe-S-cluster containining protein
MSTIPVCRRCGTCCRKGGPALHLEDRPLIENGVIPSHRLYTIRPGELARDNTASGYLQPVTADIIKIKAAQDPTSGRWTCSYYDRKGSGCRIYAHRPLECKTLQCWDPSALLAIYNRNRLTRKDLLGNVAGLWELIETHQHLCSLEKLHTLTLIIAKKGADAAENIQINRIISYDRHLRTAVCSKSGIDYNMLEFLFGRPLTEIMPIHVRYWRKIAMSPSASA